MSTKKYRGITDIYIQYYKPFLRKSRLSFNIHDRATRYILAPYIQPPKDPNIELCQKPSRYVGPYQNRSESTPLLTAITSFLSNNVDLPSLLHETGEILKVCNKAYSYTVYLVDSTSNEICKCTRPTKSSERLVTKWKIESGTVVAAHVAWVKEYVMINNFKEDTRFPLWTGYNDGIKSVLCVPIVTSEESCTAVLQFNKVDGITPFNNEDLKISIVVAGWIGAAVLESQRILALQQQQGLNDYLLQITRSHFADTISLQKSITRIVQMAKNMLGAEHGFFLMIDTADSDELITEVFDEGINTDKLLKKKIKINLSNENSIAAKVARTGATIRINDVYNDPRFNFERDVRPGYTIKSLLCMPIMSVDGVMGIIQVSNKQSEEGFTSTDEDLMKTFSVYCALTVHFAKLHNLMDRTNNMNTINLDILNYQLKPCIHDYETFIEQPYIPVPDSFGTFEWYVSCDWVVYMPQMALYMITSIVPKSEFIIDNLMQFILMVRKTYRNNPYHNWEHAFNVMHCMYNILKRNMRRFSELELKALIIAALCHDLDHGGVTNYFLQINDDTMAQLYDESPLEHHHYRVTRLIMSSCPIYAGLDKSTFKLICKEIKEAILATDLAMYFKVRIKLVQLVNEDLFDWSVNHHRSLAKAIMMTSCDLSGSCKPFHVNTVITDNLYREFYRQGDLEKNMGLCPLSLMDREKKSSAPEDQVQFLTVIVLPCTDLLRTIIPNTEDLYRAAYMLRQTWQEIVERRSLRHKRVDSISS